MKHCVLSVLDNENDNAVFKFKSIIFSIKYTKLYVPVVTLSVKDNKKLSRFLSKEFERLVYWNKQKTKSETKISTKEYRYFLESNFVEVNRLSFFIYLNRDNNAKRYHAKKYFLPKGIIDNYNVIVNGKTFMTNQLISISKDSKK